MTTVPGMDGAVPVRRVVVTGMGFVTPLGNDVETVWSNLVEGRSGVGGITYFDTKEFPTRIAAQVKDFDPYERLDFKSARNYARNMQYAAVAADQAMAQSGLDTAEMDIGDVGVVVSSGIGGEEDLERNYTILHERGPRRVSPYLAPMYLTDMAAGVIAIRHNAGGPNYGIVSACASSAHAIGEAAEIIKRGDAVAIIAGGTEAPVTPMAVAAFCQLNATSRRNDDPESASRPWDQHRDGFVLGEGSVILVLEEMTHALRRGAPILAEIAGYGASSDVHHVIQPHPEGKGAARAMRKAIEKAGLAPTDVDYVNAHGTSTPVGDVVETRALKDVFGEHALRLPVSSTKSMHGHLLGGAGALEAAVCVLAIQRGVIPPTINLEQPDTACDLDYVPKIARRQDVRVAVSNSFGLGGHNASLLMRKVDLN